MIWLSVNPTLENTFPIIKNFNNILINVIQLLNNLLETKPGEQLQIDWKEDIRFTTSDGEIHSLNVFVGVLGYSRYSVYLLTLNRKQETLFHTLDTIFEKLGGFPKTVISDNMKTIKEN